MNRIKFGQNLLTQRKASNLTQEALADLVSKESNYISSLERGKGSPSTKLLYALAYELNCNVCDLLPDSTGINDSVIPNDILIMLKTTSEKDKQKLFKLMRCFLSEQ